MAQSILPRVPPLTSFLGTSLNLLSVCIKILNKQRLCGERDPNQLILSTCISFLTIRFSLMHCQRHSESVCRLRMQGSDRIRGLWRMGITSWLRGRSTGLRRHRGLGGGSLREINSSMSLPIFHFVKKVNGDLMENTGRIELQKVGSRRRYLNELI